MPTKFNPHFNLQPTKDNKAYIILQIVCSDKRIKYSLGLPSIDATPTRNGDTKDWNSKTEEVKNHLNSSFNKRIREVKTWVDEYTEAREQVLSSDLRDHLLIKDGKEPLQKEPVQDQKGIFFKEVKNLIKEASGNKPTILNPTNNQKYSPGTLICWTKTMNNLKKYLPDLTFDVTMKDYDTFIIKLQEDGKSNSYIGALIKDWKTFMKHTAKKRLHNNQVYKEEDFKQITEDPTTQIALTLSELDALRNVELEYKSTQDEIRDMFLFNCSNGLRISDMEQFHKAIIVDGFATLVTEKTDETVVIDLDGEYYRIIEKYGKLPDLHHRNIINREIKKIAEKAGINTPVLVTSVKGGTTVIETKPKYELIKNHTARRTFITLGLKHDDAPTMAAKAGITISTMTKSYDKRTKMDIAIASRERRLKREADTALLKTA